jgi:AP-4 complex subunit mu-1
LELLNRITKVFKDYCGILSEESIRTNFVLVYELLDEMLDGGYVQGTSTETVKAYVFNEPIILKTAKTNSGFKLSDMNSKTTPSTSVDKPITSKESKGKKKMKSLWIFMNGSVLHLMQMDMY